MTRARVSFCEWVGATTSLNTISYTSTPKFRNQIQRVDNFYFVCRDENFQLRYNQNNSRAHFHSINFFDYSFLSGEYEDSRSLLTGQVPITRRLLSFDDVLASTFSLIWNENCVSKDFRLILILYTLLLSVMSRMSTGTNIVKLFIFKIARTIGSKAFVNYVSNLFVHLYEHKYIHKFRLNFQINVV